MARTVVLAAIVGVLMSWHGPPVVSATRAAHQGPRSLISEVGNTIYEHTTVSCEHMLLLFGGDSKVCSDAKKPIAGLVDIPFQQSAFTTDGSPWGVHISGPMSDGSSYLVSWHTMGAHVNSTANLQAINATKCASANQASVQLVASGNSSAPSVTFTGRTITYIRSYVGGYANSSYLSPCLHHVVVATVPGTNYTYRMRVNTTAPWSSAFSFKALPGALTAKWPLRVGVMGDTGQTLNTTTTLQHLMAHQPDIILLAGDLSYADMYQPDDPYMVMNKTKGGGEGPSNQQRWDSWHAMTQNVWSQVPGLMAAGNHELETTGINANVNYTTYSFSYPDNYPFQAINMRWPAPAIQDPAQFGQVSPYYYASKVDGVMKVIVFNNYVPFYEGTPQYCWAMKEFHSFNRTETPWLLVMTHTSFMQSYANMYKEGECFRHVWEETFYQYGVDLVLAGHVHAYERTHPVFNYTVDTCGPIHVTIGDGGNVEGPVRQFVDELVPGSTNTTFCDLTYNAYNKTPNEVAQNRSLTWGHQFQFQCQPPSCPILSWQERYSVKDGPVLVPKWDDPRVGFCQSSQPLWSAHRDPSFGHAILELESATVATLSWYRNQDGVATVADEVTLERQAACTYDRRKRRLAALKRRRQLRSSL